MTPRLAASALALALLAAAPALARAPSADERARVESALRAQGFVGWRGIEMDDGLWEVDNASRGNNDVRDIRLTPDDLTLIDASEGDRAVTGEERAAIEQALRGQGFTGFNSVSLDDGVWAVDDARGADGVLYDLALERHSLRILHREKD
ncbi:PepSY domain-containing protein [Roseomonas sp. E05]|uniref:PepSY domain-containing protein n=1 Tax=Roseomonas sp. E05 TaxID=3046310 RepID=UPI0024B98FAD|nr:PepSY domain-containing protein [Roseomonas sp. E05]MDJ0386802.1 PepSY domain-containing protein [Roseomonas sp. E05]